MFSLKIISTQESGIYFGKKRVYIMLYFSQIPAVFVRLYHSFFLNIFVVVGSRTKVFILSCLRGLGNCKLGWFKHEEHCYFSNKTGDTWMNSKVSLLVLNTFFSNKEHMYMYIVTLSRTGRNKIYGYL